ncbi:hypothetical protein FB45DRAFT_1031472 [Roridomyces roridus]|uniref:Uncharacterized protein n=1 Tax=Roridomyces roridus TaxID=1738132 RepID=A0AAD7FK44_9AGAR|nr:hypothetical protein FB45DRAFT_1031472 [Roridomyces roridus]
MAVGVKTLTRTPGRRDGGLIGAWSRAPTILQVSTFDAGRLRPSDYIDVPRSAKLLLDVYGHHPTHSREVPFAELSFRAADGPFTRPETRFRGFLHYHVPYPHRPLSGGLRFRCTPHPTLAGFAAGYDLLCHTGLPWTLPLANLMWNRGKPITQSLLRENLVRLTDIVACQQAFGGNLHPSPATEPVVHCLEQPWFMDLRKDVVMRIPGPSGLLKVPIYPAIAQLGALLVAFESTGNLDDEVALRVLELRTSRIINLPTYAHLPPPTPGDLLVYPRPQPRPDKLQLQTPLRPWTWNHSHPASASASAALHCLLRGPPPSSGLPSQRLRHRMRKWLYHEFPGEAEWEAYQSQWGKEK